MERRTNGVAFQDCTSSFITREIVKIRLKNHAKEKYFDQFLYKKSLKISHHTELINLFFFQFIEKLIRRMFYVFTCGNCSPDYENISTGL